MIPARDTPSRHGKHVYQVTFKLFNPLGRYGQNKATPVARTDQRTYELTNASSNKRVTARKTTLTIKMTNKANK